MSDYIKREDVEYTLEHALQAVKELIPDIPPADVVEVVRCKDCKYRKKVLNCSYGECIYSACMVADNDYCSNGERKDK